ncbi:MAG TPA: caspase family protein [Roseomonas sp.]|jgi:hypothetical protein
MISGRLLMRMACGLCLLLAGLAWGAGPAAAQERRVALVVGVGGYRNVPALANPPNDARDIAAVLGRLGFEVETLIDPDRLALEAGARRLGQRARGAEAALFFFAGHALEAAGRNWLVPAPAEIRGDRDLRFETLDLEGVLEQMEGGARLSILILDACRDNPFRNRLLAQTRQAIGGGGLGQVQAATGTLVTFATAPGTVAEDGRGRNSPFTGALLKHIETPGLEIRQLLAEVRREVREATRGRQVPWENSALEGSFYFRAPPPPPPPAAPGPAESELLFWESVRGSRRAADFQAYLNRFPQGVFADLARNRIAALASAGSRSPLPAPPPGAIASTATPEGREALLYRLLSLVQPITPGRLATQVQSLRSYPEAAGHRAFAVAPGRQATLRVTGAATPALAEELVLERCQLRNGEPCLLFAVNDALRMPAGGAEWPRRDMERLRYAGPYRLDRIPAITPERRREADLAAYASAREPKAMAIHPLGRVFAATRGASQRMVEEEALRLCNADPVRAGASGPCFLYAVGSRVVLPGRHEEPLAPDPAAVTARVAAAASPPSAAPAPAPPPVAAIAPAPAPAVAPPAAVPSASPVPAVASPPPDARAALLAEMLAAAPFVPRARAETFLGAYMAERQHRAFAILPGAGSTWRVAGQASPAAAEERALEACQLRYGLPCILFAVDDEIRRPAAGGEWARRDMPRLADAAAGFDPQRVPALSDAARRSPRVAGYAAAVEPKAMAIHPLGYVHIAAAAASQEAADAAALAACEADPDRAGRDGPCFLYASGNRVVLTARRGIRAR